MSRRPHFYVAINFHDFCIALLLSLALYMTYFHAWSSAQPGFWEGTRMIDDSGPNIKSGPGVSPRKKFKTYMRFWALYCICCIQITDLVNHSF